MAELTSEFEFERLKLRILNIDGNGSIALVIEHSGKRYYLPPLIIDGVTVKLPLKYREILSGIREVYPEIVFTKHGR